MNYYQWNEKLFNYFFGSEKAYKDVMLYANDPILSKIYDGEGSAFDDFINAINEFSTISSTIEVADKAYIVFKEWKDSGEVGIPPYIAYLFLFVLAGGVEDINIAPNAYYPRLWKLITGYSKDGMPHNFSRMEKLWGDLENWTCVKHAGKFGLFKIHIRGRRRHVGLPLFQTLCSNEELENLPILFHNANLDPSDIPVPEVLMDIVLEYGDNIFKNRTLQILRSETEEGFAFRQAMSSLISDILAEWDETFPENDVGKTTSASGIVQPGLRICLHVDGVAKTANTYIRFKSKKLLPEDGLYIADNNGRGNYKVYQGTNGWSSPITYLDEDEVPVPATILDWETGAELKGNGNKWIFRLKGEQTRVFREGVDDLKDWVEVHRIEKGEKYHIASCKGNIDILKSWGPGACGDFHELVYRGLPSGWDLFACANIKASCPQIPVLTLSSEAIIKLQGGMKAKIRNFYYKFAKPKVIVENGDGNEIIKVNGVEANRTDKFSEWEIPDSELEEKAVIELFKDNESIGVKIIHFEANERLPEFKNTPYRNAAGKLVYENNMDPLAQGAIVLNFNLDSVWGGKLPYYLSSHIILLGPVLGQIITVQDNISELPWQPVWLLARIRPKMWNAIYCANAIVKPDLGNLTYFPETKKNIKAWKEAIYVKRKQIIPPALGVLAELWNEYMEAARNAK